MYPPLPGIDDPNLFLSVYTHPLLDRSRTMEGDYGDTERLTDLGQKALELAVTCHFFSKRDPSMLTAEQIDRERANYLNEERFSHWLDLYSMKQKLICPPGEDLFSGNTTECRRLFTTYVGAVFFCSGIETVQNWISRLISPESEIPLPQPLGQASSSIPPSYQQPPFPSASSASISPPQPTSSPPPMPSHPPMDHNTISLVSLALVNQTASQKGIVVQYQAFQQGPAHQPTWTVHCYMNGEFRGQGTGKNQKIAREEAARGAYVAMGWMPAYT